LSSGYSQQNQQQNGCQEAVFRATERLEIQENDCCSSSSDSSFHGFNQRDNPLYLRGPEVVTVSNDIDLFDSASHSSFSGFENRNETDQEITKTCQCCAWEQELEGSVSSMREDEPNMDDWEYDLGNEELRQGTLQEDAVALKYSLTALEWDDEEDWELPSIDSTLLIDESGEVLDDAISASNLIMSDVSQSSEEVPRIADANEFGGGIESSKTQTRWNKGKKILKVMEAETSEDQEDIQRRWTRSMGPVPEIPNVQPKTIERKKLN